jgi:prefoldin alpha subunit
MTKKEEDVQKLYMEFQMLNHQIKQMEKQNEALNSNLMELMVTNQSLDDLNKVKEKSEILVPISSGIYAKTELKDSKNFIVNIGANTALVKDLISTKKIVETQIQELKKLQDNLSSQMEEQMAKAASLEQEIKSIASTIQK